MVNRTYNALLVTVWQIINLFGSIVKQTHLWTEANPADIVTT